GFDVALVEAGGERTFVTALGAESLREPGAWDLVRVRPGDAVYASGYGLVPPGAGRGLGAWAAGLPPRGLLFVDPGPLIAHRPPRAGGRARAGARWGGGGARRAGGAPPPGRGARGGGAAPRGRGAGRGRRHRPGRPGRLRAGRAGVRPGDGSRPVAEPHRGAR